MLLGAAPSSLIKSLWLSRAHIPNIVLLFVLLLLPGCSQMPFGLDEFGKPNANVEGSLTKKEEMSNGSAPAKDLIDTRDPMEIKPNGTLGMLGLNLNSYFDEVPEDNTLERLSRLEKAMSSMNQDLKMLAEPVQRLSAVEKNMTDLVAKLDSFIQTSERQVNVSNAIKANPAPQKSAKKSKAIELNQNYSPASNGQSGILGLRIGEHKDKTRLVFDLNTKSSFTTDLDNNEKLIIIESDRKWLNDKFSGQFKSPVIKSYTAQNIDNGSRIILQLNNETEVLYKKLYLPNGNKYFRMVIDLKK